MSNREILDAMSRFQKNEATPEDIRLLNTPGRKNTIMQPGRVWSGMGMPPDLLTQPTTGNPLLPENMPPQPDLPPLPNIGLAEVPKMTPRPQGAELPPPVQPIETPIAAPSPNDIVRQYLMSKLNAQPDTSMENAQQAANDANYKTNMIEAGTRSVQAVTGGGYDPNAFNAARDQNKQILNNYLLQKKQQQDTEEGRFDAAKQLAGMSASEQKLLAETTRQGVEDKRLADRQGVEEGWRVKNYELQKGSAKRQEAAQASEADYKKAKLAQDDERIDLVRAGQGLKLSMNTSGKVQSLGKDLVKNNAPQYEVFKKSFNDELKNIEGTYGRAASAIPDWAQSEEAQKLRSATERLLAPIRKDLYGSALTSTELANWDRMVATKAGYSKEAFLQSVDALIRAKDAQLSDIRSTYSPEVNQIFNMQREAEAASKRPKNESVPKQPDLSNVNAAMPKSSEERVSVMDAKGNKFSLPKSQLEQGIAQGYTVIK